LEVSSYGIKNIRHIIPIICGDKLCCSIAKAFGDGRIQGICSIRYPAVCVSLWDGSWTQLNSLVGGYRPGRYVNDVVVPVMLHGAIVEATNDLGAMVKLNPDPPPASPLANGICRSAAAEGIADNVAGARRNLHDAI